LVWGRILFLSYIFHLSENLLTNWPLFLFPSVLVTGLLEPSHKYKESGIRENIWREAMARGVKKDRIRFAKRVDKRSHLQRVGIADLFLDSFFYGAHSTATDSLRGGLPVLSVAGDAFARRVGITLLENMGLGNSLLVNSMKEFGEVAADLAANNSILSKIRTQLVGGWSSGLFNTQQYTRDFERMAKLMHEIYCNRWKTHRYMHIVV